MIDLFGADGGAALDRLARRRALYAFDFDGTLAPIVAHPADACPAPSTVALLTTLGALVPVVIVTGRAVDDLRSRAGFEPAYVVGNHGAEGLPLPLQDERELAAHRAIVAGWSAQWPGAPDGVVVEPKTYSLSVHYRHAPDRMRAKQAIEATIATLAPAPRVIGGKCVFNLLPEGAPDKGDALQALVRHAGCDAAFFIGDDITDEAGFAAAHDDWVTVRVGEDAESRAGYFIARQADIDRCIARIVATVEAARQAAAAA